MARHNCRPQAASSIPRYENLGRVEHFFIIAGLQLSLYLSLSHFLIIYLDSVHACDKK